LNEIDKTTKDQDVECQPEEETDLDKAAGEASSDRATVEQEIDVVDANFSRLEIECIEKAEPYAERYGVARPSPVSAPAHHGCRAGGVHQLTIYHGCSADRATAIHSTFDLVSIAAVVRLKAL